MAAGLLTARLLLVCALSEVSHSSAPPRAGGSLQPRAWQDGSGEQDVYGDPHPLQYMMALRQTNTRLHPNVHDQVQVRALRPYRPRSVPTRRLVETSPLRPRAHRNEPSAEPRSFDLSLNIPFAHGASRYRPSGFHIHNSFNNPLRNHDASTPGYQFSISVPVSHTSPPHDPDGRDHHSGSPQRPEFTGSAHQPQRRPYVPSDTPLSSPWYFSQRWAQTGHDGPRYPPKYVDPYSVHYRGHHRRPHHRPYWSHAQHSSPEPRSD